ncbi:hypothetical protein ABK040_007495 [Willaertia magna]
MRQSSLLTSSSTFLFNKKTSSSIGIINKTTTLLFNNKYTRNYNTKSLDDAFGLVESKEIPPWFPILREVLRINKVAIPKTQLKDANEKMKDVIRDYIQTYKNTESFEEQEVLLENAKDKAISYITNLRNMTIGGTSPIKVHSKDYWVKYYNYIYQKYLNDKKNNSDLTMTKFIENLKENRLQTDWYGDYQNIENYLKSYLTSFDQKILILANGLSELPFELYKLGYKNITCIDISDELNTLMEVYAKEKFGNDCSIKFENKDMTDLEFEFKSSSIDLVIDKAGVDSIYLEEGTYALGELDIGVRNVRRVQRGLKDILKLNGKWVVFSQYNYLPDEDNGGSDECVFDVASMEFRYLYDPEESMYIYELTKTNEYSF